MPRLLPRLLKQPSLNVKHVPNAQNVGRRKRKSLFRPLSVALPSFEPRGRTRSFLLEENPVTDKWLFARHKRLPPKARLGPRSVVHDGLDPPREMTTQEREWWSSPYLRMLATPLRQCTLSKRYLPNDFLVRLAVLRLPPVQSRPSTAVLMPDGLEHPQYKRRKARVAVYVPCWKEAVQTMKPPVPIPRHSAHIFLSKHLCAHINYLLRLRVLQELKVLIKALKKNRDRIDADATILRRLTRSEFKSLRETGMVPYSDAVAILVVPPVNRDPRTKLRPRPSQEPDIPSTESSVPTNTVHKKPLPPLSSLHSARRPSEGTLEQESDHSPGISMSTFLPEARVPMYNGLTMYPFPPHRAAFHKLLTELLDVERQFRGTHRVTTTRTDEFKRAKGDDKGSHAFLFVSNGQTVKRADTAALAIALWRLRMWEGDAFADQSQGWEIGKEWRIEQNDRPQGSCL